MTLSDLVTLKLNLSQSFDTASIKTTVLKNAENIANLSHCDDEHLSQLLEQLAAQHNGIINLLDQNIAEYNGLIRTVTEKIQETSKHYLTEDYQQYFPNSEDVYPANDLRNDRKIRPNEEFENVIRNRINLHSNWQFPCLEIGCRDGEYTKLLVASDPLYISDTHNEFLNSAVSQFSDVYQGRVRKYKITDYYKIKNLPTNQFGLIFSYNFFNYLSFQSIKVLLSDAYSWLRPGGSIIFTYNNGDLPAGAAYAQGVAFMTYVPKSLLLKVTEDIGYETIFSYDANPAYSLIELQKPGALTSIKLAQTLGEIRNKNN